LAELPNDTAADHPAAADENLGHETHAPTSNATAPESLPPAIRRAPPNLIPVKLVDGRQPFPVLAMLVLTSTPRAGEGILIDIQGRKAVYKISFVTFNPYDSDAHVTLGCIPDDGNNNTTNSVDQNLKIRMDDVIKWQLTIYDRGQTFSNAIMFAGYAGVFALWSFTRQQLTETSVSIVALLVGISLFVYISWELYTMIIRALAAHRFVKLVNKAPTEFFDLFAKNEKLDQAIVANTSRMWKAVVLVCGLGAYGGGIILLYNVFANLFHLRQWP